MPVLNPAIKTYAVLYLQASVKAPHSSHDEAMVCDQSVTDGVIGCIGPFSNVSIVFEVRQFPPTRKAGFIHSFVFDRSKRMVVWQWDLQQIQQILLENFSSRAIIS